MAKHTYFKLIYKFIIIISLVIVFTSICITCFFISVQTSISRNFVEKRAVALARSLATSGEYGVPTESREFLTLLTKNTIKEEDVLYSVIYGRNCEILAKNTITETSVSNYVQSTPIEPSLTATVFDSRRELTHISGIGEVVEVFVPIISYNYLSSPNTMSPANIMKVNMVNQNTGLVIGVVRVGLTLERIKNQTKKTTKNILIITIIVVLAGILISSVLIRIIIKPISDLSVGTRKIAAGNFSYRVPLTSKDEFRDLAMSFNSMATDMEIHIRELNKEKKELLNLKIAFEQRSQELEETLEKVQTIQQDLIKSEKFATIGRLASSVAHELRNPLASIKNIAYLLSKMGAFSDPKSKQMVDMLSSEVVRANKIITDLLDFSKTKKINKMEVPIDSFIEKAIQSVPLPENIKIVREFTQFNVSVDPDKMTQILINLISNAKDAMPAEGGKITIRTTKDTKKFRIEVEDNACGMDDETLKRIFEPLFTTKLKGIGLGLAIVKEIIEAHNGTVVINSKKGVGTTFNIEMPLI